MRKVTLVAVDIRSSHNVGAFFRTAEGFGADVLLIGITPRPAGGETDDRLPHVASKAHQAISKTALGAEEHVSWRYFRDYMPAFSFLRSQNYTICAIEQSANAQTIASLPAEKNIALIMGPEVSGLPEEILSHCDAAYEIPMQGKKESFNVSVAAGIALYQASL